MHCKNEKMNKKVKINQFFCVDIATRIMYNTRVKNYVGGIYYEKDPCNNYEHAHACTDGSTCNGSPNFSLSRM